MKLESVEIRSYRGIEHLTLPLDPRLTVLHGANGCGKTSVLTATAMALGAAPDTDYRRLELDRRVGSADRPAIAVKEASENGKPTGTLSLYIPEFRMPADIDGPVRVPKPNLGPWERELSDMALPRCRFYDIDRAAASSLIGRSVGSIPDYEQLFEWFHAKEYEELRLQREQGADARLGSLAAVRAAICGMLHDVSDPRVGMSDPPRLVVSRPDEPVIAFEQLSDGYRGVLALAADIGRYLVEADLAGDSPKPLEREIVVLIDEIELHLHPAWQQRILADLIRTFPNAQFVLSTHSPQVLTTVHPKHIVELAVEEGRVVAGPPSAPTYGAEAGAVLAGVMGVEKRPPNEFSEGLRRYMRLVSDDQGETQEARKLRDRLDELSYHDPALQRADMEIRRRKMLRDMDES